MWGQIIGTPSVDGNVNLSAVSVPLVASAGVNSRLGHGCCTGPTTALSCTTLSQHVNPQQGGLRMLDAPLRSVRCVQEAFTSAQELEAKMLKAASEMVEMLQALQMHSASAQATALCMRPWCPSSLPGKCSQAGVSHPCPRLLVHLPRTPAHVSHVAEHSLAIDQCMLPQNLLLASI
jgi:hypothetical protein